MRHSATKAAIHRRSVNRVDVSYCCNQAEYAPANGLRTRICGMRICMLSVGDNDRIRRCYCLQAIVMRFDMRAISVVVGR